MIYILNKYLSGSKLRIEEIDTYYATDKSKYENSILLSERYLPTAFYDAKLVIVDVKSVDEELKIQLSRNKKVILTNILPTDIITWQQIINDIQTHLSKEE